MIRIVVILLIFVSYLTADVKLPPVKTYNSINEHKTDIYYGNGIMTTKDEAFTALKKTLKPAILYEIYNGDKEKMNEMHNFDVAYNYSFKEKFKDTIPAMILDLVESYGQLTGSSSAWWIVDKVKSALTDLALETVDITGKLGIKIATEIFKSHGLDDWLAEWLAEKIVDMDRESLKNKLTYLISENVEKHHNQDLERMVKQYKASIAAGHGVIIISHSQGNLFAIEAVDKLDDWMKNYVYQVSIASPATKFATNKHWLISLDNDPVANIPGSVGTNVINYARYYSYDLFVVTPTPQFDPSFVESIKKQLRGMIAEGYWLNGIKPPEAHLKLTHNGKKYYGYAKPSDWNYLQFNFHALDFYMGKTVYPLHISKDITITFENRKNHKTDEFSSDSHIKIVNGIKKAIETHNKNRSQYNFIEYDCGCKNYLKLTHKDKYESSLTKELEKTKVLNFANKDENAKIYKVGDRYVRALRGGFVIEDVNDNKTCMVLLDKNGKQIGSIKKEKYRYKPKKGLIEVDLNWTNPEIDLDLDVEKLRGVHDIKDIPCPYEHFASVPICKDRKYLIFVKPKYYKKYEYPFSYTLTIKTADGRGAYNKLVVPVTINNGHDFVKYSHVAYIKVSCNSGNGGGYGNGNNGDNSGNGGSSSGSGITIAPVIPPDCPPIPNVKLPNRKPTPIYYFYGSGGGLYNIIYYGGGGAASSSNIYGSGGYSIHKPVQELPECGGSIDCIPKAKNDDNSGGDSSNKPESYAPPALAYGGVPTLPVEKKPKKECKGKYDCGCMPCEYKAVRYTKSVQLGPISDAKYSIYTLDGYRNNLPLYSGKTTKGTNLYDSGIIDLPIDILNSLDNDKLYILEVKGGIDIDANDDFIIDKKPTINKGYIYTVATGKDIKALGFKANILTTMAFTLIKDMIENRESQKKIEKRLDLIASRVLRDKIYEDKTEIGITNRDLILWLPTIDKDMLLKPYNPLEKMVQKIYKNKDIYEDAYRYVFDKKLDKNETIKSKPIIKTFIGEIPEDAKAGDIVGKIEVLRGKDVVFDELRGNDAKDFTISKDGVIRVSDNATIDYEHRWRYDLVVKAHNKYGDSGDVIAFIKVKNIPDAPEFEKYIGGSVDENATGGTKIGQVIFKPAGAKITKIELAGKHKDLFKIDLDGNIYLKEGAKLDFEKSMYYGFWAFAYNKYGRSLPAAIYVIVKNVPDIPEITDYKDGNIAENAKGGTYIGRLIFNQGGDKIQKAYLTDFNDTFNIDTNGIITLKKNAKLNYEKRAFYKMDAVLENRFGKSSYPIFVKVIDVLDVPELISFNGGNVDEYAPIGTIVGKLNFNPGKAPITKITLRGSDAKYFNVNKNGTIKLAKNVDYEEKYRLFVIANAYNKFGKSRDINLYIFVNDQKEKEPVLANSTFEILEDAQIGTLIGKITIIDSGLSKIENFTLEGDNNNTFKIDKDGKIYLNKKLDYIKKGTYKFKVYAKNSYGISKAVTLIIKVIRHTIPVVEDTYFNISENAKVGSIVGKVKVVSEGGSKIKSFKIENHLLNIDTKKLPFKIDNNGTIFVKNKLDYETKRKYKFEVSVSNSYGKSYALVTVNILNEYDTLPKVYSDTAFVLENQPKGTLVKKIETISDSKIVKYELNGTKDFIVDENGTIKTNRVFDYEKEKEFVFKVRVKNIAGFSKWKDFFVKIANVNDTVPVLKSSEFNLKENAKPGTIVGKIKIVSQGNSAIKYFKAKSDKNLWPEGYFKIDKNGTVIVDKNASLDYENQDYYETYVSAVNNSGESSKAYIRVNIENVAEELPTCNYKSIKIEPISKDIAIGQVIKDYIRCNGGDSQITLAKLKPNSPFEAKFLGKGINKRIGIVVKDSLKDINKNQFDLNLKVSNNFGDISIPVSIYVKDNNYTFEILEASLGQRVGSIYLENKEIETIYTNSSYFSIDKNGNIIRNNNINDKPPKQYNFNVYIKYKDGSKDEIPIVVNVKSRVLAKYKFMNNINKVIYDKNSLIAYLGGDKLIIVNLKNIKKPKILADIKSNKVLDMAISDDKKYIFVLDNTGLKVLNIEDLNNTKEISSLSVSGSNFALFKDKIVINGNKLKVIDVSNKLKPKIVKTIEFLGEIKDDGYGYKIKPSDFQKVELLDNVIYTTLWSYGLQAIDIKDINHPKLIYNEGDNGFTTTTGFYLDKEQKIIITSTDNDDKSEIYKIKDNKVVKINLDNEQLYNITIKYLKGTIAIFESFENGIYDLYNISNIKPIYYSDEYDFYNTQLTKDKKKILFTKDGTLYIWTLENLKNIEHINTDIALPPIIDDLNISIDENTPSNKKIATLNIETNLNISSFKCYGVDCSNFKINNSGEIFTSKNANIDYEKKKRYIFAVAANTPRGISNYATVTINVNNLYDEVAKIEGFKSQITENNKEYTKIGKVKIISSGDSPISEFNISNASEFEIDNNGTLYAKVSLDYEKNKNYTLSVKAKNKAGWSNEAKIYVKVLDLNDTVPILANDNISIKENTEVNTKIAKIKVLSSGGAVIEEFGIENSNNIPFTIDNNGNIVVTKQLSYKEQNIYNIKVYAKNSYGKGYAYITINVLEVKKPKLKPTFISVPETIKAGSKIGQINIESAGDYNITSFEIYGSDSEYFKVNNNGELYLKDNKTLDYETKSSYLFKAVAISKAGKSEPVDINITVIDEGKAPYIFHKYINVSKFMHRDIGSFVGYLDIIDNDGKIESIELIGDGKSDFNINKNGKITFAKKVEEGKEYYLKAIATNKFGKSNVADVNITVEPLLKIDAGNDITVFEKETIYLHGYINSINDVKTIEWSSPDSDSIYCNKLYCNIENNLAPGEYTIVLKIEYKNGDTLEDSLKLTVLKATDNTIAILTKDIEGSTDAAISKDKKYIYLSGAFWDGSILKIIDTSDPKNMDIVSTYEDDEAYEAKEILISNDEKKALLITDIGIVMLDISNKNSIYKLKQIETSDNISMIGWYKNNSFIYYNKADNNIYLVNLHNFKKSKIYHTDIRFNDIYFAKKKGLLIAKVSSVKGNKIYFIDIDTSKVEKTIRGYYEKFYIDEQNDKVYYKDWSGKYKVLDISHKKSIHKIDSNLTKYLIGQTIISNDENSFYTYDLIDFYPYGVIREINLTGKTNIINVASFKNGAKKIFIDSNKNVAFIFLDNTLRAVKLDRNDSDKILDFLDINNLNWFKEENYAYGFDYFGRLFFFKDNNNNLSQKGKVELRLPCYPDCGYSPGYYPLHNILITENSAYKLIYFEDNSSELLNIDISNKEDNITIQLDKNIYDENPLFKLIKNSQYIAILKHIDYDHANYDHAILYFKDLENKQILSQIIFYYIEKSYYGYATQVEEYKNKILVLIYNKLHLIDATDIKNTTITNTLDGYFKKFVISGNKIYAIDYYNYVSLIEINNNKLKVVKKYRSPIVSKYINLVNIAISPDSNKIALLYSNGEIVEILDKNLNSKKITFIPENYYSVGLSFKKDNILFVNGFIMQIAK